MRLTFKFIFVIVLQILYLLKLSLVVYSSNLNNIGINSRIIHNYGKLITIILYLNYKAIN